jgi:hypothetical protein
MSAHYTFSFMAELDSSLSSEDIAVVEYLLGDKTTAPETLPKHSYFKHGLPISPYAQQYRDFSEDFYSAVMRVEHDQQENVAWRVIDLKLPSQKLEGIYEDCLPLVSWLASLSCTSGLVGSFVEENVQCSNAMLLFIYQRELYMGSEAEVHSFLTGNKRCFTKIS